MSGVQLAPNVDDIDAAVVFYSQLFDAEPAKRRPEYANFALDVSKRAYVLETGKVTLSDKSSALRENPEVQRAYLGA